MSFLTSLVSAFKGGGGARVPQSRGFVSPWSHWGATAFDGGPPGRSPFDYAREVAEAYLANPVAQRAVRIVAEGVGSAPIACAPPSVKTRSTPAICAAASTRSLRSPRGVGTTITSSETPATRAGSAFINTEDG